MDKTEKTERIRTLEEIYESFRCDPLAQRDIRIELKRLKTIK